MMTMKTKSYEDHKADQWKDFKDKLSYIKSSIDPLYLLSELGFKDIVESSNELRCACIIHGGDNETAFRYNKRTNTWVCFTHKCQDNYNNDVVGLVMAITKKNFMEAVEYLKRFCASLDSVDFIEERRKREIETFINTYSDIDIKPKSVNEESLRSFRSLGADYFINQGFLKSTIDYFEIGHGWVDKHSIIRSVIPIRNDVGELVAYSLRDEREEAENGRKYILTSGFNKQNCLYNMDKAKHYGEDLPIIVVEGFKSVWRLHELGIKNVVAAIGSGVTEGQQFLLCLYALKGVVLFLDNDSAGVLGTIKACKDLEGKLDVRPVFIQEIDESGKGLDPADLTDEQIYEYLNTYY